MKILVCGEIENSKISELSGKTVTAALKLGSDIDLLFIGHNIPKNADGYMGVSHILYADHEAYAYGNAENSADLLVHLAKDYDAVLAPATSSYKNILPRACAFLDVMMLSDVIEIIDSETYKRPIYAGNAIATLKNKEPKKVMTIRTTAFETALPLASIPTKIIDYVPALNYASKFVAEELSVSERPQLASAKRVVSGGRGVGSQKNFELIQNLADKMGAAVGASRAAVDAGFVPNDYQVGQTGKVVAPDLYIAVGISGAIQHLAGMKDSKIIAAINKDPEATIFSVADVGLVADLFVAVPELEKILSEK